MKVLIVGDMHADKRCLQRLGDAIDRHKVEEVWQCGDLGFWPRLDGGPAFINALNDVLAVRKVKLYFADGNHEDHEQLYHELDEPYKLQGLDHVWHCPRGSVREPDGVTVMYLGGARSVDRIYRREGRTWFPDELPNLPQRQRALENGETDIIISHDVPHLVNFNYPPHEDANWPMHDLLIGDEFRRWLGSEVLTSVKPQLWFGGHHHVRRTHLAKEVGLTVHVLSESQYVDELWLAVLDTDTMEVTSG